MGSRWAERHCVASGPQVEDALLAVELKVRCDDVYSTSHMNKAVVTFLYF